MMWCELACLYSSDWVDPLTANHHGIVKGFSKGLEQSTVTNNLRGCGFVLASCPLPLSLVWEYDYMTKQITLMHLRSTSFFFIYHIYKADTWGLLEYCFQGIENCFPLSLIICCTSTCFFTSQYNLSEISSAHSFVIISIDRGRSAPICPSPARSSDGSDVLWLLF